MSEKEQSAIAGTSNDIEMDPIFTPIIAGGLVSGFGIGAATATTIASIATAIVTTEAIGENHVVERP